MFFIADVNLLTPLVIFETAGGKFALIERGPTPAVI
jgi:hypothetical protein